LTVSADFDRVRAEGQSWSSPTLVLRVAPGPANEIRYGLVASKRLGKAVRRNRARRLVREAMRQVCARLTLGWDLVFVIRSPALGSKLGPVRADLELLARRAGLLDGPPEDRVSDGGFTF
jgi:ribonuclease P protein component